MKAYPLPSALCCAVCGFVMEAHGVFTGGAIVVACTGRECPEFEIQRKWQVAPVDLDDIVEGDLVPMDEQPAKPVATPVPTDPVPVA